jgi:prepilin-type processing-associated H-X9-DG protein
MPSSSHEAIIEGIGTAVPAGTLRQDDAARIARETCAYSAREAKWSDRIYERVRVHERGCTLLDGNDSAEDFTRFPVATGETDGGPGTGERLGWYTQPAAQLASESARAALVSASAAASEITHLVTASCTGFAAPGVDIALIESLGLNPGVSRTHIGFMGCHAALNALRVARAFVQADADARVLVSTVELCSLHFSYGRQPDRMLANALFADGSASAVIGNGASSTRSDVEQGSRCPFNKCQIRASGSHVVPDSADAMTWHIGDHGFEMSLSPRLPDLVAEQIRPWLERWLAQSGLDLDAVGGWAIHPGGPRILEAVAGALNLPDNALDASFGVLASHGNMSSPTILFILDRLLASRSPLPCVCLGFGPGLAIEAMLVDGAR